MAVLVTLSMAATSTLLLPAVSGRHSARAQSSDDPLRFVRWLSSDIRAVPAALVHTPPLRVAAAGLVIATTSAWDAPLSRRAQSLGAVEFFRAAEEFGDADAMRPLALVIFVGTLFEGSTRAQNAAFTSMEALALANLGTNILKVTFGRARPFQDLGASSFEPFSGNSSFPSGHATTVFAGIMPWVFYYPGTATWVLGGLALATTTSRVALAFHWPSDVLGGAFVGTTTAWWLSRRHGSQSPDTNGPVIEPITGARTLGFRVRF